MATPHYNYFPPAGQVIDLNDKKVTWDGRAWRKNGKNYSVPSTHRLIGKPGGQLNGWTYDWSKHAWMDPTPVAITPARSAAQSQTPAVAPEKETTVEKKTNVLDSLIKHPVAPVLGGVMLLAAYLTDSPQPPSIPADLPDATRAQWQMIFNQNQQTFQRRMDLYEQLGMLLLGYSEARAVLDALPPRKSA
jgi:hypothetical protein